jgi:hypothetical protein
VVILSHAGNIGIRKLFIVRPVAASAVKAGFELVPVFARTGIMLLERSWLGAACVLAMLLTAAATGCFGPNAASVSGTVTLDGQPLAGGNVSFHPDGGSGAPAYGQSDANGRYSLSTGSDTGLAPGMYVAVVVATKEPPQPYDAKGGEIPPIPITPAKYADVSTSDLRVEVKAGRNDIPLALQSPGKAGGS